MSFFDDFLPSIPVIGPIEDSLFGGDGPAMGALQSRLGLYQNLMGQLPQYDEPGVQAAFKTGEAAASNFAKGQREAGLQEARTRAGGGAASGGAEVAGLMQSGSSAANRLSLSNLQAVATNKQMLNDFNQRNMMNKLAIAHGESQAYGDISDLQERQQYARRQNLANMWNQLTNFFPKGGSGGKVGPQDPKTGSPYLMDNANLDPMLGGGEFF